MASCRLPKLRAGAPLARPAVAPRAQAQGFEKGLSGDVLAMFHEAQRNILELNKSRLMALDELRQARERIEELEAIVRANGGSVPSTSSRNSSKMTVAYSTGWDEVFIHYQRADGSWTELPGESMLPDPQQPGLFVAHLDVEAVEFVFNNGENDWDSPMAGGNYVVKRPGQYLVQSGTISEL